MSTLKGKELKRLDLCGYKVYLMRGWQLGIACWLAILSRYNFTLWKNVMKFKDRVPDDSRQEFIVMVEEGKLLSRAALQDSLDAADSAVRTMASAITMRIC